MGRDRMGWLTVPGRISASGRRSGELYSHDGRQSGKGWFPIFRFYGPDEPRFRKTWKPPDIEKVKWKLTVHANRTELVSQIGQPPFRHVAAGKFRSRFQSLIEIGARRITRP
jgi:hypothetical protein